MRIETININEKITVSFGEIPGMVDYSESSCLGLRYLTTNVRSDNRRKEVFATNVLIHELFGDNCYLKHKANGVPYLESENSAVLQISLSHCRDLVAVAYSQDSIGVDVEEISDRVMRVRERVQSLEEQRYIGHSLIVNTIVWTAKEAMFKVVPEEGVDFAKDLVLDLNGLEYISSAGLRVLLSAQKKMQKIGSMKVRNVCEEVMEIFEITGFVDILVIE